MTAAHCPRCGLPEDHGDRCPTIADLLEESYEVLEHLADEPTAGDEARDTITQAEADAARERHAEVLAEVTANPTLPHHGPDCGCPPGEPAGAIAPCHLPYAQQIARTAVKRINQRPHFVGEHPVHAEALLGWPTDAQPDQLVALREMGAAPVQIHVQLSDGAKARWTIGENRPVHVWPRPWEAEHYEAGKGPGINAEAVAELDARFVLDLDELRYPGRTGRAIARRILLAMQAYETRTAATEEATR